METNIVVKMLEGLMKGGIEVKDKKDNKFNINIELDPGMIMDLSEGKKPKKITDNKNLLDTGFKLLEDGEE